MTRGARPLVAALLMSVAESARGATLPVPCGLTSRPWIRVQSDVPAFVDAFRAEVAPEGFDACADGGPAAAIAVVSVARGEGAPTVEIVDVLTLKRVSRTVDLRSIPPDGRDLALAAAADELLRASWAELALVSAPSPPVPVPAPVQEVVAKALRTPEPWRPRVGEIGVVFAGEAFTGGQIEVGADARAQWFVTPHFAATLRVGLRSGVPTESPEGRVRASVLLAGIGALYRVVVAPHVDLGAFVRADALDVTYSADTTVQATASSGSAVTVLVGAGGVAGWSVLPAFRLNLEVGAAAPIRPVQATEATTDVVVGVRGVGALVGVGAGALF
jgi:hypothetical protein